MPLIGMPTLSREYLEHDSTHIDTASEIFLTVLHLSIIITVLLNERYIIQYIIKICADYVFYEKGKDG